jgi:hypothetical protein
LLGESFESDGDGVDRVEPLLLQRLVIVDFDSVDPFHREHPSGGQIPVDLRDVDARVAGQVDSGSLRVATFIDKIKLLNSE